MKKLTGIAAATILVFSAATSQALPVYITADFSGGVNNVTAHADGLGLQRCDDCPEGLVNGSLQFDKNLMPATGSGMVTLPLGAIPGFSDSLVFSIFFGGNPLSFHFEENSKNGPELQFSDGVFSGMTFTEKFTLKGDSFQLSMDGKDWEIRKANKKNIYSQLAAQGHLHVGHDGLVYEQVTDLSPAEVPEPATLVLLGLGFLGLIAARRRYQ